MTMKTRRLSAAEKADFSIISSRPDYLHTSKSRPNSRQNMSPYEFMVNIPPSPSKSKIAVGWGRRHDDGDITATGNDGIFSFPNALGRGQPFPRLYLPFCVGVRPVSSASCQPGALIVLCWCTDNNRRDAIGSCQWHFDG